MSKDRLELSELIDLEVMFHRDRDTGYQVLSRRDHDIGSRISRDRPLENTREYSRARWFRGWLEYIKKDTSPETGADYHDAYHYRYLPAVLCGMITGFGIASGSLLYSRGTPVNTVLFISVLGVWPLFLFLLFIFRRLYLFLSGLFTDKNKPSREQHPLKRHLLKFAAFIISAFKKNLLTLGDDKVINDNIYHGKLYSEALLPFVRFYVQVYSISHYVAAFVTCLVLLIFADISFYWGTTISNPEIFHKIIVLLALPWSWFVHLKEYVPTLEVIKNTQYLLLENQYYLSGSTGGMLGAVTSKEWAWYLLFTLLFYGIILRGISCSASYAAYRHALNSIGINTTNCKELHQRLTAHQGTSGSGGLSSDDSRGHDTDKMVSKLDMEDNCFVILWRDIHVPEDSIRAFIGEDNVIRIKQAGGKAGDLDGELVAKEINEINLKSEDQIMILVESFESPDRALKNFILSLRGQIAPEQHIMISLVDVDDANIVRKDNSNLSLWVRTIMALGDPYTGVMKGHSAA